MDMNAKREFLLTELERMLRSGIQSGDVVSVDRIEGEPSIGIEFPRGERFFVNVEDV